MLEEIALSWMVQKPDSEMTGCWRDHVNLRNLEVLGAPEVKVDGPFFRKRSLPSRPVTTASLGTPGWPPGWTWWRRWRDGGAIDRGNGHKAPVAPVTKRQKGKNGKKATKQNKTPAIRQVFNFYSRASCLWPVTVTERACSLFLVERLDWLLCALLLVFWLVNLNFDCFGAKVN